MKPKHYDDKQIGPIGQRGIEIDFDICEYCESNRRVMKFDNSGYEYGPLVICPECLRWVLENQAPCTGS